MNNQQESIDLTSNISDNNDSNRNISSSSTNSISNSIGRPFRNAAAAAANALAAAAYMHHNMHNLTLDASHNTGTSKSNMQIVQQQAPTSMTALKQQPQTGDNIYTTHSAIKQQPLATTSSTLKQRQLPQVPSHSIGQQQQLEQQHQAPLQNTISSSPPTNLYHQWPSTQATYQQQQQQQPDRDSIFTNAQSSSLESYTNVHQSRSIAANMVTAVPQQQQLGFSLSSHHQQQPLPANQMRQQSSLDLQDNYHQQQQQQQSHHPQQQHQQQFMSAGMTNQIGHVISSSITSLHTQQLPNHVVSSRKMPPIHRLNRMASQDYLSTSPSHRNNAMMLSQQTPFPLPVNTTQPLQQQQHSSPRSSSSSSSSYMTPIQQSSSPPSLSSQIPSQQQQQQQQHLRHFDIGSGFSPHTPSSNSAPVMATTANTTTTNISNQQQQQQQQQQLDNQRLFQQLQHHHRHPNRLLMKDNNNDDDTYISGMSSDSELNTRHLYGGTTSRIFHAHVAPRSTHISSGMSHYSDSAANYNNTQQPLTNYSSSRNGSNQQPAAAVIAGGDAGQPNSRGAHPLVTQSTISSGICGRLEAASSSNSAPLFSSPSPSGSNPSSTPTRYGGHQPASASSSVSASHHHHQQQQQQQQQQQHHHHQHNRPFLQSLSIDQQNMAYFSGFADTYSTGQHQHHHHPAYNQLHQSPPTSGCSISQQQQYSSPCYQLGSNNPPTRSATSPHHHLASIYSTPLDNYDAHNQNRTTIATRAGLMSIEQQLAQISRSHSNQQQQPHHYQQQQQQQQQHHQSHVNSASRHDAAGGGAFRLENLRGSSQEEQKISSAQGSSNLTIGMAVHNSLNDIHMGASGCGSSSSNLNVIPLSHANHSSYHANLNLNQSTHNNQQDNNNSICPIATQATSVVGPNQDFGACHEMTASNQNDSRSSNNNINNQATNTNTTTATGQSSSNIANTSANISNVVGSGNINISGSLMNEHHHQQQQQGIGPNSIALNYNTTNDTNDVHTTATTHTSTGEGGLIGGNLQSFSSSPTNHATSVAQIARSHIVSRSNDDVSSLNQQQAQHQHQQSRLPSSGHHSQQQHTHHHQHHQLRKGLTSVGSRSNLLIESQQRNNRLSDSSPSHYHSATSSSIQLASSTRTPRATVPSTPIESNNLRSDSFNGPKCGLGQSGSNASGLTKKSNSATQLSMTGTKNRLGFRKKQVTSFSVHRSEEVVPLDARHLVKQGSSVSEGESSLSGDSSSNWSNVGFKQHSEELTSMNFIEGLGKGQMISRQGLASPYLGDIQLSLCDRRGNLEVEVIRARNLVAKANKIIPMTYVKLYLVKNRKCLAKAKTTLSTKRTLDPLFQQQLTFHEDYHGCILQSIVWGNFGKMDKKNFMGIAQISIDDLELSETVISWYKLFLPSSLQTMPSKSLRHTLLSNSTESFTNTT